MIPTSTQVVIEQRRAITAEHQAIVTFHCSDRPLTAEIPGELRAGFERIRDAAKEPGKARDVSVTLEGAGKKLRRLMLIGAGESAKLTAAVLMECAGVLGKQIQQQQIERVAVIVPVEMLKTAEAVEAIVEGFLLASFKYREYRAESKAEKNAGVRLTLIAREDVKESIARGQAIAGAQNFARTVAFRPGNDINPATLAEVCQEACREVKLKCRVMNEKELTKLNMGGILAVGAGAQMTPPRMIVMEYSPAGAAAKKAKGGPVLLVGKAITFDTGGISIKPADKMGRMVFDKCGGTAVLGAMVAVAKLKLPIRVVGILAAAENHISETAYRPGDILRMHNGVTVEVTNTDAEGRLVLADAMEWGIKEFRPRACVDLATLTGGVIVALGRTMAGIMGNDQRLMDELIAAGKEVGEKMWQLPLPAQPREMLKSDYADVVNSAGRDGHPLQGGAFLSLFVPEIEKGKIVPWAHLDIAGVADTERDQPLYCRGATGWGIRTLVRWLAEKK